MAESARRVKGEYVVEALSLEGFPRATKSLPVTVRDHIPAGKSLWSEQERPVDEIEEFLRSPDERVHLLKLPTAAGKTLLAAAAGNAWTAKGGKAILMAPTKDLQVNFRKELPGDTLSVVFGGVEYRCVSHEKATCGALVARRSCGARRLGESGSGGFESACPYNQNRIDAGEFLSQRPACFTPHSYLAYAKHPILSRYLPQGDGLMVVDEAHLLPDQLRDFVSVSIQLSIIETLLKDATSDGFVKDFFGDRPFQSEDGLPIALVKAGEAKVDYIEALRDQCQVFADAMAAAMERGDVSALARMAPFAETAGKGLDAYVELEEGLRKTKDSLSFVLETLGETHWVIEAVRSGRSEMDQSGETEQGSATARARQELRILLRPTAIPRSFLKRFFSGFSKVILMTGTLFPVHLLTLGLSAGGENPWAGMRMTEANSRIHVSRRKAVIDVINGMPVNNGNLDEASGRFAHWALRIARKLPGEKGIIHTSSHARAELVARKCNALARQRAQEAGVRQKVHFWTIKDLGWKETFKAFKDAKADPEGNIFLVMARRYEGIDLVDDLARINLFFDTPFANRGDTMIRALEALYPGYYDTLAVTSLIQGANRTTRHPADWSLIAIFASNSYDLLSRFSEGLPEYTKEAFDRPEEPDWIEQWRIPDDGARRARAR